VKTPQLNPETAVQELIRKHKIELGKKYKLHKVQETEAKNGGTNFKNQVYQPIRTIKLERNPVQGTGIYDLEDQDDFKRFFENNYGNLPNGIYTAMTGLGRGKGFSWFFLLRLENGKVVEWWEKSKGTNPRGHSSTYYALQYYFNKREELGV